MVAKVIAGRIWRHVGEHHVERLATKRCQIQLAEVRFVQFDVLGKSRGVDRLEVHRDHRTSTADAPARDL